MSKEKDKKPPKKARKAISKLHKLIEYMEFYTGNTEEFRKEIVKELASPIEEALHDLSVEKNIDHIKLATKLKTIWKKEKEEEVEREVEKRLDDIKEASKGDL